MHQQLLCRSDICAHRPCRRHGDLSRRFRPALLSLAIAAAFAAAPATAQTLPIGGVVVHGQASFNQPAPNQLVVTTHNGPGTGHSAINWQSFSISAGASTRFVQPSAASLSVNRVVTDTPSAIFGSLSSNGRLVLVNQSGIAIGAGALVDTAGFTASSLRMTDADAIAGRLRFGAPNPAGGMGGGSGITVEGVVTARDGDVMLVAPQISVGESALIQSPNGSTLLAAGQQVEISGRGLEGIRMLVQARESEALNLGHLQGDAVGIFAGTLRHSGEIQATTAMLEGGKVVLKAAGALAVDGAVLTTGSNGRGGQIHATGDTISIGATALLDASGSQGGGEILVGGGWHGQDARIGNARRTVVADGARLAANATDRGDGGSVVVWADQTTRFAGSIRAAGGEHGGDGGHVEVSGKQRLDFHGQVDLSAPRGRTGSLLLDPSSITIGSIADVDGNSTPGDDVSGDIGLGDFGTAASMITAAQVSTLLNTVDLSLQATGDITVTQPINKTSGPATTLTLYAGGTLDIDAPISGASGSPLGLSLTSEAAMATTAAITTFGGSVDMSAGFGGAGGITLNGDILAGSGNVTMAAHGNATQAGGVITASTLTASGSLGSVTLNGANNVGAARLSAGGGGGVSFNNVATSYLLGGTGSNGLTVTGTGSVTVDQTVNFTSVDISANNGITLAADVTSAGNLDLTTSNSMISQSSGKITAIQTSVNAGSGDIALTSLTNDTQLVSLVGGHITMQNAGDLIVTSLTSGPNKNVFLQSGGALTMPAGAIDTGTGQLSLTNGSGAMTTPGALTGSDILLNSQGDLTLAHPVTSNGSSTMTLSSGGTLSVQAPVNGHGINMDAVDAIDIQAAMHATSGLTVTSGGANTVMQVHRFVGSDGTMNLTLTGGLSVLGSTGQTAALDAGTGQTISARFVEVIGGDDGSARILNNSGAQSISTFGVNDSGEGVSVAGSSVHPAGQASIYNAGSTQTITVNDADYVRVIGSAGKAEISSSAGVGQTIVVQGVSSQNRIEVGSALATSESFINANPGPQSITAGLLGQDGGIALVAGVGTGNEWTYIGSQGDQTLRVGSGGIQVTGGGNNSNVASITQYGLTGTQSVTSDGNIAVAGGTSSGSNNRAEFFSNGSGGQSVTLTGGGTISIVAGAGGTGNNANIGAQNGNQTISGADGIVIRGGANGGGLGLGNTGQIYLYGGSNIGNQSVSVGSGGLLMEGGGGTGSDTDNSAWLTYYGTGSQTITISGGGNLTLNGGSSDVANVGSGHGNRVGIDAGTAAGVMQSITLDGGDIVLTGGRESSNGGNGSRNWAGVYTAIGSSQTISGAANIRLFGGPTGGVDEEGNRAFLSAGLNQVISASNQITLTGGENGTQNNAHISLFGASAVNQTIAANRIVLAGGLAGGGFDTPNSADIQSDGSQTINVGAGGLSMTGGGGALTDNAAQIGMNSLTGTQTINVAAGATVLMQGGSSLATTVGPPHGSRANIYAEGTSQTINFGPGGTLDMRGGTAGQRNFANLSINNGNQVITGSPAIIMQGGTGGGVPGEGNFAIIHANNGNQTITASSITMSGGTGGVQNLAQIRQGDTGTGLTGVQAITVTGSGATLSGGNGTSNFARIQAHGTSQTLNFSGGNLLLNGGTGASDNHARVQAVNGSQSITGAPDITVTGGSAGADLLGNFASITATANQSVVAHNLSLYGGATGIGNYAALVAPSQNLTVQGDLTMTGGGSAPSSDGSPGSAFIGGNPSGPAAITLNVTNNVTLSGGTTAGAAIGSNRLSSQPAPISITAGGDVTLIPGAVSNAGARIGSSSASPVGGNITITAGADFGLSGSTPNDTVIRTLGDVNISSATATIGNSIIGNTVRVAGTSGVSINTTSGEIGTITASAVSGDSIKVESGGNFFNSSGPAALSVAGTGRWLVYSTDPDLDTRGGLVHAFRQFGSVPGDTILGSGNGFIHSISKDITVTLNSTGISKVYDGTTNAPLTAANYIVPTGTGVVNVTVNLPTVGTFDNRNVGTGKTVSVSGITIANAMDTEELVPVYGISVTPATLSGAIGTITPASITVSTSDISRPYDGTTTAIGIPVTTSGSLFGTDTLTGGSYAFQPNGNVGSGKTVTVSGVSVNDGNNGANYVLTLADNNNSSITPAALVLSSSPVTKVYDATTSAAGALVINSGTLFGNDSVSGGVFAFQDKNAGTGKAVTVDQAVVSDGNNGQNYAISYVNNTSSTITKAGIAGVSGITAANKVYDGNTDAVLTSSGAAFAGRLGTDVLTVAGASGSFADRNAGSDKVVAISGITLGGADAGNYTLINPSATTSATITPAPLTISTSPVSKTFDGNTSAAGTAIVTAGGLVAGDTLGGGEFAFLDKNVGLNKTVTVDKVNINDGNGGGNYAVTYVSNLTSSILSLGLSTWTGSADNRWTNPANWADGTVPDATNVLAVVIPAGTGDVLFDASAGTTSVQNLNSQRPLNVTGGTLLVGTDLSATDFSQSGGAVSGGGNFSVAGSFTQTGGSVNFAGISISQTSGNLSVGNLNAPAITLAAPTGQISQFGPLTGGSLSTTSQTGTVLAHGGNQMGSLSAVNTGGGDIRFVNRGPLSISTMSNPSGDFFVTNTGAITTVGPITASNGNVGITANSPLTIGAGGVSAGGNIALTASNLTSAGDMTLNGPLDAGDTVSLVAGNNLVQNSSVRGANGVTATAGGTMSFGSLATTNNPPVSYSAGGRPVAAPPATVGGQPVPPDGRPGTTPETPVSQAARETTDLVVTFLDRFQKALDAQQDKSFSTDADGNKKPGEGSAIVTEEEICR